MRASEEEGNGKLTESSNLLIISIYISSTYTHNCYLYSITPTRQPATTRTTDSTASHHTHNRLDSHHTHNQLDSQPPHAQPTRQPPHSTASHHTHNQLNSQPPYANACYLLMHEYVSYSITPYRATLSPTTHGYARLPVNT